MELLGKSREELQAYAKTLGEPAYRGGQIYHALYAERKFEVQRFSNLPVALRGKLRREATVTLPVVRQRYQSSDGSLRYLFQLPVGSEPSPGIAKKAQSQPAAVEAVFMPSAGRQTICISTQAGCAVDCQFCLTAKLGLIRNLTAGEMLAQVLLPLVEKGGKESPRNQVGQGGGRESSTLAGRTNVVLMGQGEPLLNFDNVMAALRILLDPKGVGLSAKRVTLSTSGVVPGIARLAKEQVRPKLAISLNASCDQQRDVLMPINKKYPLKVLVEACRRYPLRNWEHLTFEYVMLGGVNDTAEDAQRVVQLLAPLDRVKVNLIPWNPGELPYKESSPHQISAFQKVLAEKGVPAFVRYSRGRDVMAACGQLALQEVQNSPLPVLG
jgi:23S rRNA (adenine2503-C2)-methyltransferase